VARVTRRLILVALVAASVGCTGDLRTAIERFVGVANEGVVCVDGSLGDDGNPGSPALPKRSIEAAIALAEALGGPRSILVAEGVYLQHEPLRIVEGISVRGGYASGSWQRDIEAHSTRIQAVGIDAAIEPDANVTSQTTIEGLHILAAALDTACCIWCDGCSPTITRCTLDAGAAVETSIGIYIKNASPVIEACTIDAGAASDEVWGIANVGSRSRIRNCIIVAGGGPGLFTGISCSSGSDAFIQNNTLWAGAGGGDAAVYLSASHCTIDNNIFFPSGSGCGIYEYGPNALPARVWHNDFWCSTPYHGDGSALNFAGMLARFDDKGVDHRNNGSVDPDFVDLGNDDYHLAGSPPIPESGCDLSAAFSEDRDGVPRTIPWSIGAYEKD
jgi:hypothetical protein